MNINALPFPYRSMCPLSFDTFHCSSLVPDKSARLDVCTQQQKIFAQVTSTYIKRQNSDIHIFVPINLNIFSNVRTHI